MNKSERQCRVSQVGVEDSSIENLIRRIADGICSIDPILALSKGIDHHDALTGEHTLLVGAVAVAIAEKMRLSEREVLALGLAAMLHDIGKLGIPDYILNKRGGLTRVEREIMRSHSQIGYDTLSQIRWPAAFMNVPKLVLHHHERLDGTGYPDCLTARELGLEVRILTAADVFSALIQERPYKRAMRPEKALQHCRSFTCGAKRWYDPEVVEALDNVISWDGFIADTPRNLGVLSGG